MDSGEAIASILARGMKAHQAGRLDEAERLYQEILQRDPAQADALHLTGVRCFQTGRLDEAIDWITKAIASAPARPEFHDNLGGVLAAAGRDDEAATAFEEAIRLKPDFAKAHFDLGSLHKSANRLDASRRCLERAIEIDPRYTAAMNNLANVYRALGEFDRGRTILERALAIRPGYANALVNLGLVLQETERFDESAACFEQVLASHPDHAAAHNNLANALKEAGRVDDAIDHARRAVEADPGLVEAHRNLGNLLVDREQCAEARESQRRAIRLDPAVPDDLADLVDATVCPTVFEDREAMGAYRARFESVVTRLAGCGLDATPAAVCAHELRAPFNLQFLDGNLVELKRSYAALFSGCFEAPSLAARADRPRIGLVVTPKHEAAFIRSLGPLLGQMSEGDFDFSILCSIQGAARLRDAIAHPDLDVRPLRLQAKWIDQVAVEIARMGFDVLYYWEVGTDAINYFLPFYRLAPVQCTSWGIQVTSGIPTMDFYLSSALVEADAAAAHYSERLLLASTVLTCQRRLEMPLRPQPPSRFGLSEDQHFYLCPHQLGKFHPDFDPVLRALLMQDDHGVVVITSEPDGPATRQLKARFERSMPEVATRVKFLPRQLGGQYTSLLAHASAILDPTHFGGVNTTFDALGLNLPVLTRPSDQHRSRMTCGCYRRMEVDDLVAGDDEELVATALRLARDEDYRRDVCAHLTERSPQLFEDDAAVGEHERLFGMLVDAARSAQSEGSTSRRAATTADTEVSSGDAPIFIGGAGRSGTTLLRVLLDVHPHIACGVELKVLPSIAQLYASLQSAELSPVRKAYDLDRAWIDQRFRALIDGLLEPYRARRGKPRWAEKTPHNLMHLEALGTIFPDARFLHVVRDGRDVACSLVTMDWVNPATGKKLPYVQNIGNAARYWREVIETVRAQTASMQDRVFEVRYESLVTDTETTMREVLQFLDEPWDDAVLHHHERRTAQSDDDHESSAAQARRPIYATSIGQWRHRMNARQKAAFKREAGDLLVRLGYADGDGWASSLDSSDVTFRHRDEK
ncbi:MAG: hypothetical protein CMJ18_23335 [Phycisphaeraceae bacterium]|nr:hypothetical protein [Phycisphaeraceae bacterium]